VKYLRTLQLDRPSIKVTPTRRQLLKALGVSAAAAPLFPALNGWAAGNATAPRRLLLMFTPDGIVPDLWNPTGTETNFSFPTGGILEQMNRHKQDMIFLKNLKRQTGGSGGAHEHAMGGVFTGHSISGNEGMGPSVDQVVAQGLPKGMTDFQSLQFGVQSFYNSGDAYAKTASVNSYMLYSGPKARVPAETDPYKMFDRIFGNFTAPKAGAPTGPNPTMEKIRMERQSILDYLKGDVADVQPKLGKDDKNKIAAHLDAIREIEHRLAGGAGGVMVGEGCAPGTKPPMLDLNSGDNLPMLMPIMNKLLVSALACDRTRIASMQYSRGFSNAIHKWVGANATHHTLSHGAGNAPVLAKIQTFYFNHVAKFFDDLKAVNEGGVPMLDNMLVVYANEVYLGWTHGPDPGPCFWAGKLGGTIKTGRFLEMGGKGDWNQMLTTAAHAMGVNVPKIGDLGTAGTLAGLVT
jgi:hypothetical protein